MNEWTNRWLYGWMDGWVDGWMGEKSILQVQFCSQLSSSEPKPSKMGSIYFHKNIKLPLETFYYFAVCLHTHNPI